MIVKRHRKMGCYAVAVARFIYTLHLFDVKGRKRGRKQKHGEIYRYLLNDYQPFEERQDRKGRSGGNQ